MPVRLFITLVGRRERGICLTSQKFRESRLRGTPLTTDADALQAYSLTVYDDSGFSPPPESGWRGFSREQTARLGESEQLVLL